MQITRQYRSLIRETAQELQLKFTLKRLNVETVENQDDVRFNFFTKKMWQSVYAEGQNYTVLFVPQYFDFVKLRHFIKNANAQVAMISEYTDKAEANRARSLYELEKKPILMLTERAITF